MYLATKNCIEHLELDAIVLNPCTALARITVPARTLCNPTLCKPTLCGRSCGCDHDLVHRDYRRHDFRTELGAAIVVEEAVTLRFDARNLRV